MSIKSLSPMIIVLLVLGMGALSPVSISPFQRVYATTRNISLVGYYSIGWNNTPANPTITITQGDTIVLTTSSGDGASHHFFVGPDRTGMNPNCSVDICASVVMPSSPKTDTLTGFTQGSYKYFCEYHSLMKGTFIVQASMPPPPPPPNFSITANPSSLTVVIGSSGTTTITLTSQNGFTGNVNLTGTPSTSGLTVLFNPVKVSLTSGGSKTSNLTIATSSGLYSSTSAGSYTVTVTATGSPSLSQSAIVPVTVASTSSPAAPNIPASVLIAAGVAIVAVILVVSYTFLRRRPRK